MPQLVLPLFSPTCKQINNQVGFEKIVSRIYYFHGSLPVFSHEEDDLESFRFITSQLVVGGNVKQHQIVKAFGISAISVKRSVKQLREHGAKGFFRQSMRRRSAHVLTPEVKEKVQKCLYRGQGVSETGKKFNIKSSTIYKAIQSGQLEKKNGRRHSGARNKSERAVIDSRAGMGLGCTREQERIEAAFGGLNEAVPVFVPDQNVKSAGVLFALPALLLNGLLKYANNYFSLPKGYYGLQSFLLLLAFAALLRIKSLEAIRYCEAGELGKTIGLDRIPEIRTLRKKVKYITNHGNAEQWGKELSKYWMEEDPELAGILYVDGHVRVYSGSKTRLPKRYVSRQKLCLSGLTDYWVNDIVGKPFFVVSKAVNPGLLSVMREQIIPQLLRDVPKQPVEEELNANRHLYRFGVVFDREGYSPEFSKEMWEKRIACYTYKKYVNDVWPELEFMEAEVAFYNGEAVKMRSAERGVYFRKQDLWVRKIRKLTDTGHQTSVITTDFLNNAEVLAGRMFSRWSQENFLKYMMEHYGIDRLIEYEQEEISETTKVVNPLYRGLESQRKAKTTLLNRQRVKYGALVLKAEGEEHDIRKYVQEKSTSRELIDTLEKEIEQLKATKKNTEKHIEFSKLPEDKKFQDLKKSGKQFVDTIKMIAYRAETAMANTLQEYISKKDEARSLVRQIFMTDADITPDEKNGVLRITIHNMTNPRNNRYVQQLCDVLNSSETLFPGTNLRLVYDLVSNQIPPDQEF